MRKAHREHISSGFTSTTGIASGFARRMLLAPQVNMLLILSDCPASLGGAKPPNIAASQPAAATIGLIIVGALSAFSNALIAAVAYLFIVGGIERVELRPASA
jgi:hypothetical protein